jgi:hypothetical protein
MRLHWIIIWMRYKVYRQQRHTSWTNLNWNWMMTVTKLNIEAVVKWVETVKSQTNTIKNQLGNNNRLRSPWTWWLDTNEWVDMAEYMLGVRPWYLAASICTVRGHDWLSSACSAWYLSFIWIWRSAAFKHTLAAALEDTLDIASEHTLDIGKHCVGTYA